LTILETAGQLRRGSISSRELTLQSIECIERLNPRLNAFQTIAAELALKHADEADREFSAGVDRGPLQGIPIALKDVYETRGIRTTCGSRLFADYVPDRDSAVGERLTAAGAVLMGKTGMHELAYGITSGNPHFGAVRNPWNTDRIPGGSSGGSGAAVASDMVFVAMGSDTGGSIRIPAAYCGTVGLKPTFGRVSRFGVMPLDFTLDHMGPLTRSVEDAAIVLQAIAGYDDRDHTCSNNPVADYLPSPYPDLKGLRIGLPENFYFDRVNAAVKSAVERMSTHAREAGAEVMPVHVPDIASYNTVARMVLLCEASACMEHFAGRFDEIGADVRVLLEQGRLLPATDYINAQRLRRIMQAEFNRIFDQVDVLFTPASPIGAPPIGSSTCLIDGEPEDVRLASTRLVRAINMLGLPALSVPCGFDSDGMPLGLQIIGRAFDEATLLRIGQAVEVRADLKLSPPGIPVG
jgi:aspartyl-tRNA(Asn)/glutamyl-tRNA(Gln) amidotransferase subunit A